MTQQEWNRRSEWPLIVASLIFLAAYSAQVISNTESIVFEVIIWATWAVFVLDYAVNLYLAPQRGRWFVRNLHELAIVALPALRPLRLLRLVTLLRVMHRVGGNALRGRVLTYVLGAATLLIYAGALAVLDVEENAPGSNLASFGDALWWAMTTITTVGYGDHYPVTVMGRCVAAGLMIGGVAVLGVVTASVASWMVETVAEEAQAEIDAAEAPVHLELQRLSEQVQRLTALLEAADRGRTEPPATE
ncbi:potassium channel family protein [Arthrobacter sp. NPDC057259]|uniref:potassium channel family protein n=1 Tax=Arthrobacter sp. NPDC057259 TaxID=3346073 RepID=UPI00363D0B69